MAERGNTDAHGGALRRRASAGVTGALSCMALGLVACGGAEPNSGGAGAAAQDTGPVARTLEIEAAYVKGYFAQFPEEALTSGYPDAVLDRMGAHGPADLAEWGGKEDGWLQEIHAIRPEEVAGTEAEVPYGYLKERLEASIGRRVCRVELWNVSPTWTGWQNNLAAVFGAQPVGSEELRAKALARARDLPRWLDDEIADLREGLRLGYSAPKGNVERVIEQMDGLLSGAPEASPFFSPAQRDSTPEFVAELRALVGGEIHDAIGRYRTFLVEEYLPAARTDVAVSSDPGGRDCYLAEVRYYTSLPLTPEEIQENGFRQMEKIQAELGEIGRRNFGIGDPKKLLESMRSDPRYTFRSREEIVDYARAAVERAKAAVPDWFGFVPKARLVIRPYAPYQERSAPGAEMQAGSEDGTRPALYLINTYEPRKRSRAGIEATAFHEAYPGHHLQGAVALERGGVSPISRYFFNSGFGEGWALYSERLADEMGLYSSDVDRVGLLSNEAFRAGRLVVDAGMHALGWSRQRAIDYLLAHTVWPESRIAAEVDRYIAVPGQATSYMTGSLEIRRLRAQAKERLGGRFDIKAFHDRVLEHGTVTLSMLDAEIERWVAEQGSVE